jgi:hypothetical protein
MQKVTFRAPQASRFSNQRRFCACLLAVLVAGFCANSAKAAFEDGSGGSSSDWTGTDGSACTDSGQSVDFTVDNQDFHYSTDVSDLNLVGHGGTGMDCSDMPVVFSVMGDSDGGATGGSSGGSTGGSSSASMSIGNTAVLLPEPSMIGLGIIGGLSLLARRGKRAL